MEDSWRREDDVAVAAAEDFVEGRSEKVVGAAAEAIVEREGENESE